MPSGKCMTILEMPSATCNITRATNKRLSFFNALVLTNNLYASSNRTPVVIMAPNLCAMWMVIRAG